MQSKRCAIHKCVYKFTSDLSVCVLKWLGGGYWKKRTLKYVESKGDNVSTYTEIGFILKYSVALI